MAADLKSAGRVSDPRVQILHRPSGGILKFGLRGAPAKGVDRESGAWVRIPLPPLVGHIFVTSFLYCFFYVGT